MSVSESTWQKIKQEMDHVAQFRALNENDWDNLCAAIQAEILESPQQFEPLCEDNNKKENIYAGPERRAGDRRQGDRRKYYEMLSDISEEDRNELYQRIYLLSMGERSGDERAGSDRRKNDRRRS